MFKAQFVKRLKKKAKKGNRGYPLATIAFYGPDATRATKAAVSIFPREGDHALEPKRWRVDSGDIRQRDDIAAEMIVYLAEHDARSVVMADGLLGCPHEQGKDYQGDWCTDAACSYWHGRDRFIGKLAGQAGSFRSPH